MTTSRQEEIEKSNQKLNGYQPRHIGKINYDFCLNRCLEVDGILVPFPDCYHHGKPFTRISKCGTIEA